MDSEDRIRRESFLRSAVLRGDEQAWRTWYEESFDGLAGYVSWRCAGLRQPAEDVIQETWLIAVRQIRQFDPAQASFAAWLRGIAFNVLRNQMRKRAREEQSVDSLAVEPSAQNSMEKEFDDRERAELIGAALAAIPEHYELVLRAKYLDGQSVEEIAFARSESPKAVESLLTRARQAFRRLVENREDIEPLGGQHERARNSQ